jgi:hypothetical protein
MRFNPTTTTLIAAVATALCCTAAHAQSSKVPPYVKFEGAIGSTPLFSSNLGVTPPAVASNAVLGINPGGRPWVMRKLEVTIGSDASIRAKGRGLLLGGGDTVGTRGAIANVALTLFCGGVAAGQSDGTPLDTAGNFSLTGVLKTPSNTSTTAVLPATCTTPVLLVRNFAPPAGSPAGTAAVPGAWFAAGIVSSDDD